MGSEQPALTGDDYRVLGEIGEAHKAIRAELGKRIIGQEEVIEQVLTAFFAGGHVLLLGVPGLAKTLLISTLSEILGMDFNRIQFTPDLMPSDITGSDVLSGDDKDRSFQFMGGPIFANFVLADEINRTPPKTQAALLEAMEEFAITVAGKRYPLPRPYFVMATQNPIEQEGTYLLPAAALDRFMFTVLVDYPEQHDEMEMLYRTTSRPPEEVNRLLDAEKINRMLSVVRRINMRDDTLKYAIDLVRATRPENKFSPDVVDLIECGGSPRATQALILGAKARAALEGRDEALPDDVRAIALPAMHHRILTNFHAEADAITSRDIVRTLIRDVRRPDWDIQVETVKKSRSIGEMFTRLVLGKGGTRRADRRTWDMPDRASGDQQVVMGRAGLTSRFFASMVDSLICSVIFVLLFVLLQTAAGLQFGTDMSLDELAKAGRFLAVYLFAAFAVIGTLLVTTEATGGTPGKRLLGIRVMTPDGDLPGAGMAVARLVIWAVLAPVSMIVALSGRSISDMATGTEVVALGTRDEWVEQNTRQAPRLGQPAAA
ncbi:MAG: AAA family ATPase [Planctomycetes bacterium]|nr:AAA family ATPase [Planctomycetota bacterium]